MELVYHLSEAARRRIVIETGDDPGEVQALPIDPAHLRPADRRLIIGFNPELRDTVHLMTSDRLGDYNVRSYIALDEVYTDPAALLDAYRRRC